MFVSLKHLAQGQLFLCSPTDSPASPNPAVHHPYWVLSCGPTRLRYRGSTKFTELVQSGFSVAFFFDDTGVERGGGRFVEGVDRVKHGWIYVLSIRH